MAIVAQTDGIQLGAQKEMTRYTIAVAGGTLHVVALRNSEGSQKSITTAFVASGLFQSPSKFVTINVATGTLAAGNASGGQIVYLTSTNAAPGAQAMRTPAQILADGNNVVIGVSWTLRIINTGAGTLTLATDSGAGFTMTGTMTVLTNTFRDFIVTVTAATTGTVQSVGTGTMS